MGYAIRVKNFGGLLPRVSARELPDNGAQVAHNLDPTTPECRPLANDTQVVADTTLTNPLTLYRLDRVAGGAFNTDMTLNWVVKAAGMSFVKSQDNSDTTERTFATFNDGGAPPRAYDVTDMVTGRLLGVPAPTVKPTIVVNVNDEFTTEERTTAVDAALLAVVEAIRTNLTPSWVGAPDPGDDTDGYVNLQADADGPPTQARQARVYCTGSINGANNGAITETYSPYGPAAFSWLMDPQVSPFWATSNADSPAWQGYAPGAAPDHLCIGFAAYGQSWEVNELGLTDDLSAITRPGEPEESLLTEEQIDDFVATLVALCDPENAKVSAKVHALRQKVIEIKTLLDGGTLGSTAEQLTAYYANDTIDALIEAAVANGAEAIWNAALQAAGYTEFTGGGA